MAILGDLLVQGRSRFLQKIYAASLDIGEDTTIAGTLTLSKTNDAIGTSNNSPALVVGGTATTAHLELDSNEIMAKTNGTTAADIYINADGGVIYLSKSGIETQVRGNLRVQGISTFTGASTHSGNLTVNGTTSLAGTSISSDLNVANNAKVNGVLTVEEEIRSPKWIIDNIANLGGEFIIAPTIVCESNTSVNISGPSNNLYTITVIDGSITSNTFGGIAWSTGSVVKVSGTINDTVLVSINGTMTRALNQTTGTIQFTVNSSNITLTAGTYTGTKVKNLHIMMYKVGNVAPVGIFMTSYGQSHYPYIDIYSGTTSGSFYSPTTRLGYLNGLTDENGNALKINNISPTGWGLYTSNGYFSGTIVSTSGKIGGFNLDTTKIYSGTNSISSTTVGVYLGTDGIRNYNSASQSVTIKNGIITAIGADVSGKITATSGEIGGFTIDSSSIHTKNVAVTSNADNSISLSSTDFTRTINNTPRAGLRFAIGDKFGITGDGVLYTNGANITNINANNISTGTVSVGVLPESVKNENIEIGGRNLLYKRASAGERTTVNGDYSIILNASENSDTYFTLYTRTQLVEGTTYVISCEASGINGEGVYYNFPLFRQGSTINGLTINKNGINSFSFVMNDTELEYHVASTVGGLTVYKIMMDDQGRNIEGQTGPITLTNFKLEKGNIVTDWTPAPEDQEALITNTRTWYATCSTAAATTAKEATTTDSGFVLKEGVVVDVKFTNTNTGAVGSLTLNVNGTGAKSIKTVYNDSLRDINNAGQLYANSIIHFIYNGTYWIAETNYNSDSNALYTKYYNTIIAGNGITAESIIGGQADGKFYQIKENSSFDLAHPLLWTTAGISSGGTNYSNIYTQCYDRNLGTYYTSFTNTTKNCLVYLVGTVSGNTFTTYGANSASYLTVTPPTTADGRFYIPIGRLGNSSNGKNYFNFQVSTPVALYAYIDGKFRQVTPTDIVATQRIYYRSNSSTKPNGTGLPTTWVTENGNKFNTNATTAAGWSKKVSPMTSDGVTGSGKYIYLWTCEQRKRLDGTIDYTEILLDDSTTIIDGGNIITGSIVANKIAANAITADKIAANAITADKIAANAITANLMKANVINAVNNGTGTINADKINASNLTIGYSQLTNPPTIPSKVSDLTNDSGFQTSSQVDTAITSKGYATTTQAQGYANTAKSEAISAAATDATNKANAVQTNLDNLEIGGRNLLRYRIYNYADASNAIAVGSSYRGMYCAIDGGETYTISRKTIEGNRFWIEWSEQEPSSGVSLHVLSNNNTAMKVTVNTPSEANWLFIYLSNQGDEIHDGNIKIERGTKATDWTPAPEDVDADISLAIEQAKAPIDSKTYTGIIGTANSFAGANFFFGKLYPDNYNKGWQAKLRIECEAPDTYQQSLDITFGGYGSTFSSYDSVTSLSSARAFYYFELFRATSTGINVNVGHMLGISLQSATNPTNSSYARTIRVDILEVTNCTIELNNTAVAYTSMAGYSVENYGDGTTNLTQMSVAAAGQNATNNTNTNDTARYVQFYNTIVAGEALVKESLIGGHEDGKFYQISGANDYFMLSQPLLWTTIALNANATNYANIYTQCYDRNLATYYTAFANTLANKIVYLVGTIDGNKFTIYGSASNQYLTVTEPTTADGRFYIPLGRLGNQSNGKNYFNFQVSYPVALYAYLDGKFRQVTPTEVVGEQYIYHSVASGTNSMAKYETWVETPTNVTASTQNSWTIKRPEYSSSYPVLFVAKQTKRLDGTVTCTTPVKDDTTTIIDGGHITTGTIDASVVTVTNLDASEIKSGTIDADRIDVSAISIGSLNGASDYATKSDAQGYANAKDAAIAAAAKRTDVSIAVTAINYDLGTATLQATLYVDGTATTSNVTYKWLKDGSVISGQTARTLSVTAAMGLSHVYSCTVTYS